MSKVRKIKKKEPKLNSSVFIGVFTDLEQMLDKLISERQPKLEQGSIKEGEIVQRFLRILRKEKGCCPQCGAIGEEPCLTWRAMTFWDGTRHEGRV